MSNNHSYLNEERTQNLIDDIKRELATKADDDDRVVGVAPTSIPNPTSPFLKFMEKTVDLYNSDLTTKTTYQITTCSDIYVKLDDDLFQNGQSFVMCDLYDVGEGSNRYIFFHDVKVINVNGKRGLSIKAYNAYQIDTLSIDKIGVRLIYI